MQKLPSHLYGESIFTSTRSLDGIAIFKDEHLKRLFEQVNDYYFFNSKTVADLISHFDAKAKLEDFAKLNPNHALRLTVFAGERSELVPKHFSLSNLNLELSAKELSPKRDLKLKMMPTPFSPSKSNLKAGSYFQNFYFRRKVMNEGFDDVVFFNESTLTEASTSNLLFGNANSFFTPIDSSLFSGLGLEILRASGLEIIEKKMRAQDLIEIDSCYLVNSVNFLTPVASIDHHTFTNKQFETMLEKIDISIRSFI